MKFSSEFKGLAAALLAVLAVLLLSGCGAVTTAAENAEAFDVRIMWHLIEDLTEVKP